jgi:pimeloyl-ACP methyl ester carboxylesterase
MSRKRREGFDSEAFREALKKYVLRGDYAGALKIARAALKQNPDEFECRFQYAKLLGDWADELPPARKLKLKREAIAILRPLTRALSGKTFEQRFGVCINLYYQSENFRGLWVYGRRLAAKGERKGHYAQAVGAGLLAQQERARGKMASSLQAAEAAVRAWGRYGLAREKYYFAHYSCALALALAGRKKDAAKRISIAARLSGRPVTDWEFSDVMKLISIWLICFSAFFSCMGPTARADCDQSAGLKDVPLVFVPGFMGSVLETPEGETRWLTGAQALGLVTPELKLPQEWAGERQASDGLRATHVLDRVNVVPFVLKQEVYRPWLDAAAAFGRPFVPFAYDWRRDNLETLASLERKVVEVAASSPSHRVQIVGHSNGGLLAFALMNRRPELIQSAVFAGAPFAGGIGFLDDLHRGTKSGLNGRILSPEVLFTFPSVYSFFPLQGSAVGDVSIDFYSVNGWAESGLGVFSLPGSLESLARAREFLGHALARAKAFRELLAPTHPADSYPPIVVVSSHEHPTPTRILRDGPRAVRGWDLDSAPREPGDGRVAEKDARVPAGVRSIVFPSAYEHSQLLNDTRVIEFVRRSCF